MTSSSRGSVLIASLWAMMILSVFAANLGFQGAQHALLMKREILNLEARKEFLATLDLFNEKLLADPEPHEDSFRDEWRREEVEDEESKLNLNTASEAFLHEFLKLFEEKVSPLKGERKDFVKAVLKLREKERIASLEELYLLEEVEKEDIENLLPLLTVYPEFSTYNLNTLDPLILEALVKFLPEDDYAKKELLRKILEYREGEETGTPQVFRGVDLEPNPFLERLGLRPTLQNLTLANQFLPHVSVDSRTFRIRMSAPSEKKAEAVVKQNEEKASLEILYWHED